MADLRSELRAINDQHGGLTPRLVVETARPKNHPLHAVVFDKPVKEAAEAYYLDRARELIRTVRREVADDEPDASWEREYVAVRTEAPENGGYLYKPAEEVALDPMMRKVVLREMEREWRQLRDRYKDFSEFVEMVLGDMGDSAAA